MRPAVGEGYRFAMLGDNDADVDTLLSQVRSPAEAEINRQYLERASDRHVRDVRSDAEIIELHGPGPGTGPDDA